MMNLISIIVAIILVSISVQSQGTMVTSQNGVINCDGVTCPKGSTSCVVRRKTFGDASFFKYERVCGDANGVETYRTEKTLPNPHPGTVIDSVSNYGGNLTDEEKQRMANEAADIEAQMRNIFRPGFPFNDPGFNPGFFPSFGPGIPPANPVFGPGFPF